MTKSSNTLRLGTRFRLGLTLSPRIRIQYKIITQIIIKEKQIQKLNQKNMIEKSEYVSKYVFQEQGITRFLCERSCVKIVEILLCEGRDVEQWLKSRFIYLCLRLIFYLSTLISLCILHFFTCLYSYT